MKRKKNTNKALAQIFSHIAELLEINSVPYKPAAYRKAMKALEEAAFDVADVYQKEGLKDLQRMQGVGKSIAAKMEEYVKRGRIAFYEELKKKTALREIVTHFFKTKDIPLDKVKMAAKKKNIVYARHAAPAAQLLELAGSVKKAKAAIDKVATWANSRELDYSIETVFKKWLELDRLWPKKAEKKAYYKGHPMVWSENKKKWFVVSDEGEWLEFADKEDAIDWKVV